MPEVTGRRVAAPPLPWRIYECIAMVLGLSALALICLAWTPFALLLHPLLPARWGRPLGRRAIMIGFRLYTWILQTFCACRFDLRAVDALAGEGGLVVVANHPSLLDAVLILSRLPNAVCVMKASLMRNWFFGAGARLAGYITNDSPLSLIRQARGELRAGAQLVIFPEGTRTTRWPINPCQATAGVVAARARVPVQALLIHMSSPYLGKRWGLWNPPQLPLSVSVTAGRRLPPMARPGEFGAEIERYYQQELTS